MPKLIIDREKIKKVFFEAMLAGYAEPVSKKKKVPDYPRSRATRYKSSHWLVIDTWTTNSDTGASFGSTCVYRKKRPVWFMQYAGVYPKSVVWFLKDALRDNYEKQRFTGGRGYFEYVVTNSPLEYRNTVNASGFEKFNGREVIIKDGTVIGYHFYNGGLMINT